MKTNSEDVFQDLTVEQRKQAMIDQGCKSERTIVNRPFSEEELIGFKDVLSVQMIELNLIEEELKEIKDKYKAKMKPFQQKVSELLTDLRLKYHENEETVFMLSDYSSDTMNTYDEQGKFIVSRKLYPQERQTKIVSMTGTNN